MTVFVVVLEHRGIAQVVREPMDALRRLADLIGIRPKENESLWHAVRQELRRTNDNALISLHALDAPIDRPTRFLDVDVANDPDPFERLLRNDPASALREGLARDVERWQELDIDPLNRCRFLLREFELARQESFVPIASSVMQATSVEGLIESFVAPSAKHQEDGSTRQGSHGRKNAVALLKWRMPNAFLEPKTASAQARHRKA